ncbi:MAG: hypothetical protein IJ368_11125 [Oscillospiraceae bacterium]|nr:hypothetical protein [Oscillospiraceae bacterium]
MIALIIIGAIVLLFAVLFAFSVRIEVKFYGGVLDLKVKYMFLTLFSLNTSEKKEDDADGKKNKKTKKKKKKEEQIAEEKAESTDTAVKDDMAVDTTEASAEITEEKPKKPKLSERIDDIMIKIEQLKIVWEASKKGLTKLFRHIYITDIVIDFTAGGEDACAAGVNFGKLNAIVYNVINIIRIWFVITIRTVDINCDFTSEKSVYDAECTVTLRVGTAVSAVLMIAWALLMNLGRIKAVAKKEEPEIETVKN